MSDGGDVRAAVAVGSADRDVDALKLQTIAEQQHIILRQRELVCALKAHIEGLEHHQQQQQQQQQNRPSAGDVSISYTSEVLLRRHASTLEVENAALYHRVEELCAELRTLAAQLQDSQRSVQAEKDASGALAQRAEVDGAAAAQLVEAAERRTRRLHYQLEGLRRDSAVVAYECAQWRALATTAVGHLDPANQRYAALQIQAIADDVRRFADSRLPTPAAPAASLGDTAPSEATRRLWSRSAQLPSLGPSSASSSSPPLPPPPLPRPGAVAPPRERSPPMIVTGQYKRAAAAAAAAAASRGRSSSPDGGAAVPLPAEVRGAAASSRIVPLHPPRTTRRSAGGGSSSSVATATGPREWQMPTSYDWGSHRVEMAQLSPLSSAGHT
ncbi:hypothetical protein NESM_000873900 [Novymonas esmeraldas]|uniref:Uncharacterized protein n=1 Tax=Novymonas esmeraldas TaxID=1808958 RepID=A0AAW0EZZ6_9TRYP